MALSVTSAPFQQINMPALDLRRFLSAGFQEGVVSSGDMAVAQRAAGANMSVDIAAGTALVQGDSVTNQGLYLAYNDATFNLTGFTAAHATLPRIDRVALRVRDAFHGDAANDLAFVILTGTATSGATLANLTGAASVPAGHLVLANVLIPATATTITTGNIGDARPRAASSELAYAEVTSNVSITNTVEATADIVVTAPSVVTDGVTPIRVAFQATSVTTGAGNRIMFYLFEDGTVKGVLADLNDTAGPTETLAAWRRFIPTAGTHTYSIRARVVSGTGTVNAGAGGSGNTNFPTSILIVR